MSLDTSGFLLEGIRVATGNNPFTYPPRDVVSDAAAFGSSPGRADYMLFASGQAPGSAGMDIGDPALRFQWSRNNGTVVRFDFDAFARRWNTLPGGPPDELGPIGNQRRLIAPVPDPGVPESPYSLYLGSPTRLVTFSVTRVETSGDFGSPPAGSVQISMDKGELNFGPDDLANLTYAGQNVYLLRQSFFDRTKSKGRVGSLPQSSAESYHLFLNPVPGPGQTPRVRLGFRRYLPVLGFPSEGSLPVPAPGTACFAGDTGRIVFAPADIDALPGATVYYDGVVLGSLALSRGTVGPMTGSPVGTVPAFAGILSPATNPILDPASPATWAAVASTRFALFFALPSTSDRFYLQVIPADSSAGPLPDPPEGFAVVDSATGSVTVSLDDVALAAGADLQYVDTLLPVEHGASVQLFRSAVNGSGLEQEPDFVETYAVSNQTVQDGLTQAPSVLLPTVPLVDASLKVSSAQASGGGGTFVGDLVDGADPSRPGLGYLLDLDNRQVKFSFRKGVNIVLPAATPSVKLPDPVVVPDGLSVKRNGSAIRPGVDFDFDPNGGLVEFVDGIGEDDPLNVLGVSGDAVLPNRFVAAANRFDASMTGMLLFIPSGPNVGFRTITGVVNPRTAVVDRPFAAARGELADVRTGREVVADRFWTKFAPSLKKIGVFRKGSGDSDFVKLADDAFTVLKTTGQVNLGSAARPGDVYRVDYVWLQSPDNGVTVTPTPKTSYAAFKVRQETATVVAASSTVRFNAAGDTVDTDYPMDVYVDGVTQEPASYKFVAPDTLVLGSPLAVDAPAPLITVNYYVRESPGGNTFFTLPFAPIDVDYPVVLGRDAIAPQYDVLDSADVGDAPHSPFNGDQTTVLVPGGALLADDKQVLLISKVSYDAAAGVTNVTFSPPPDVTVKDVPFRVTGKIDGDYLVRETAPSDVVSKGGTSLTLSGNRPYRAGMVVFLDGDAYKSISASYKAASDTTEVVIASPATRNYILPTIFRTVRPVLEPGGSFQTSQPAHTGYPFTLVKDGPSPGVLRPKTDYNVAEGGLVTLTAEVGYGDTLEAMYVARTTQPAGTALDLNYASQVSPSQANGLQGQKLVLSYNLYSPDTFYFRRESVVSFIPEVVEELQKSASSGSSGPNTASKSSLKTKDMGSPSLYFDEQHVGNFDVVVARLLKFYNDLINTYEDILSDLDGRVVGGTSGRFRFDGRLDNPARTKYSEVTNDVDDKVALYSFPQLTGFFSFEDVTVYGHMYDPNSLSRIYPTASVAVAALNNKVTFPDFLKTLGSLGISNLTSVGVMTAAPAVSRFVIGATQSTFVIPANGDARNLVPPFAVNQKVRVYADDGSPEIEGKVLSASATQVVLDTPTALKRGSIVQNVADPDSRHFYSHGKDLIVNFDNGVVSNMTLPPFFASLQNAPAGNEIVQAYVTFANTDTTPRRPPVLDGLLTVDSGRPSVPPLARVSEADLLAAEGPFIVNMGTAKVSPDKITLTALTIPLASGKVIQFLAGPNAGVQVTVNLVLGPTSVTTVVPVTPPGLPLLVPDPAGSDFIVLSGSNQSSFAGFYSQLLGVLNDNTATAPVPPALIGKVDSELVSVDSLIRSFGTEQASGTGNVLGQILVDGSANFANAVPPVTTSSLLYVPSGPNRGLHKITYFTSTSATVAADPPFPGFVANVPTPYVVIQPWSFVSDKETKLAADFLAATWAFWEDTVAWSSSPTAAGATARAAAVTARQADVARFVSSISAMMTKDDKLYDTRYLWIQQRTDKQNGTVAKRVQAQSRRYDNAAKLVADQQKLLITSKLTV